MTTLELLGQIAMVQNYIDNNVTQMTPADREHQFKRITILERELASVMSENPLWSQIPTNTPRVSLLSHTVSPNGCSSYWEDPHNWLVSRRNPNWSLECQRAFVRHQIGEQKRKDIWMRVANVLANAY